MKRAEFLRTSSQIAGVAGALLMLTSIVCAQTIAFTDDRWDLKDAEVKEYLGRPTLAGTAWLKDTMFEDGVIEVDVATDRQRSYPAVIFRWQAEGEYEQVYLRPHRAGLYPDAVQYAPVFNGIGGWQLYSGPGFTAGTELPENQWIHLRIEVKGVQARVFVGDTAKPVLVVNELKRGKGKGKLGLAGPRNGSTRYANFSFSTGNDLQFDPAPALEPIPGIVAGWSLSPVSRPFTLAVERCLDGQSPSAVRWQAATAEAGGLVDIAKYCKPMASGASKVWARTTISSDRKEVRPFAFGYSDDISIYLNGQMVFHGNSGFQRRDPSFLGIIGWNDTVYLPLEKGANELILAVTEVFGGWGFMFRDMNATYQHGSLTNVWELSDKLNTPESVAYDAKRDVLLVSNFGDGTLSRIGLDGTILARKWAEGLAKPTGLVIHGDKLLVVERAGVAEIDLETGRILNRIPIAAAGFLNDLSIDEQGIVYVTDTNKNRIYRLVDGRAEIWLEGDAIKNPNGICVSKDRLLVGVTADGALKSVDLKNRQVATFITLEPGANMDGLLSDGKGGYLFSDFYGRIYRGDAEGRKTLLLDRRGPKQFCADFGYVPEKHLIVVPSLYDNRLTAYSYRPEVD
jgi:sugar lactone lactonase YvrE